MKMKRILGAIAIAIAVAASFSACNNQPPFAKLISAVDSTNVALQHHPTQWCDSATVTYDQITNAVKYSFYMPGQIDKDQMAQGAELFETGFLAALAQNTEYNLTAEIVDAKANVLLDFKGAQGGEYEILLDNAKVADAYYAAHPELKK